MTKRVGFLSCREPSGRGDGISVELAGRSGMRTGTWELAMGPHLLSKARVEGSPERKESLPFHHNPGPADTCTGVEVPEKSRRQMLGPVTASLRVARVGLHIVHRIGCPSRFILMFEWAWASVSDRRGARLITGNPETPSWAAPAATRKR